ncbi:MAG: S49 family peptidase [Burkholderiaceae bacterium]
MSAMPEPNRSPDWERATIEKVLLAHVNEQRRARRWSIAMRMLTLLVLAGLGALFTGLWPVPDMARATRHTALIDIDGVIEAQGPASADALISSLRAAFKDATTAGVVLRINSPGGSPVQAGQVHDEIRRLRAEHPEVPVHAVIDEICASGGYYIAAAAEKIFVDKASLVGSIGVLMDGFGFTGLMDKAGVERRLITAGENKGFLDPFSPMNEAQREHARTMLGVVHQQFIDVVKAGRGDRLKDDPGIFSGLVWTGQTSIELGLADAMGSVNSVARDVIKAEEIVNYTQREGLADRLAKRVGVAAGSTLARLWASPGQGLKLQ